MLDHSGPNDGQWSSMDSEIAQVTENLVEYGIAIGEAFKDAVSCVLGQGVDGARRAQAEANRLVSGERTVFAQCLDLLGRGNLSGDQIRRLGETQRMATAYHFIADHVRQLAALSITIATLPSFNLWRESAPSAQFLVALVRQTFVGMRGSYIVASTHDPARASMLLTEVSGIQRNFGGLEYYIKEAIGASTDALGFHYVLLIGTHMRDIGSQISAICRIALQAPGAGGPTQPPGPIS